MRYLIRTEIIRVFFLFFFLIRATFGVMGQDEEVTKIITQTIDAPLSFIINQQPYNSDELLPAGLVITFSADSIINQAFHRQVVFTNQGTDTLILENVLPFGKMEKTAYITGQGDHRLSRSHLFLPEREALNVILPDNAWELGYASTRINDKLSVAALARRNLKSLNKAQRRRFTTTILPGGKVAYDCYFLPFEGRWQVGLRRIFQEYKLFDVLYFDNTLFDRADLQWIQNDYVMHLFMAWDHAFYNQDGKIRIGDFLSNAESLYGGDDAIGIWPTWPTLGLDQRNQFDLFRDLPGGLDGLKQLASKLEQQGSGLFICYNPWDESTRGENHLDDLYQVVKATQAHGVVLDTRGASSFDLQAAADSARSGVVMYSEGMAVPKDMQGIVSGRVHNALYYPPLLNLNRLIKPDFSIFRVAEVAKEPIRREIALSYFNGHGIEFNVFAPGKPAWLEDQYRFLGQTVRVLRDHSSNFSSFDYLPLIPTTNDRIYVNAWPGESATIYTIFNLHSEGFQGALFAVRPDPKYHYFDLFNYQEVPMDTLEGTAYAKVDIPGFTAKYLGTNNEGTVGGIAKYERLIDLNLHSDALEIKVQNGDSLYIWAGVPDYSKVPLRLASKDTVIRLYPHFGPFEGKIVVQLRKEKEVIDQQSVAILPGTPRLISSVSLTRAAAHSKGMIRIPGGDFTFSTTHGDAFIRYPSAQQEQSFTILPFYMDQHPVTNEAFSEFLHESGYQPQDSERFLLHWPNGVLPDSLVDKPVVYISYEDAQAYAKWVGKRLPTEVEWQYAAQAGDGREWPWSKDTDHIYREQEPVTNTLTVYRIKGIDPGYCNLGDGHLNAIGTYPKGANPYGLQDLVGSVWQLTNDVYTSGSYTYIMMKGGSYFNPSSSWWYVQGGPRELHYRQYLLRVSQGFERNATVGFRCVQDISPDKY